jgi:Cof subfamily protein (haloacid dehalogenase superfamily)
LLDQHHRVTPRARAAILEFQRRGGLLVLTTARPPRAIRPLYRELGLTGPVIAYNGALVYDPGRDVTILHHPIPREAALRLLATIRAANPALNVGLELADEWHVDRIDERLQRLIDAGVIAEPPLPGDLEKAVATSGRGVSKIYFLAPPDVRRAVEEQVTAAGLWEGVAVTSSGKEFVEFVARGVNKGSALRALAALLSIPLLQTLALGDEENDIPLLQAAGLGIAMGNATDQAKRAARLVAGPNTADGWAEAVETHVLAG